MNLLETVHKELEKVDYESKDLASSIKGSNERIEYLEAKIDEQRVQREVTVREITSLSTVISNHMSELCELEWKVATQNVELTALWEAGSQLRVSRTAIVNSAINQGAQYRAHLQAISQRYFRNWSENGSDDDGSSMEACSLLQQLDRNHVAAKRVHDEEQSLLIGFKVIEEVEAMALVSKQIREVDTMIAEAMTMVANIDSKQGNINIPSKMRTSPFKRQRRDPRKGSSGFRTVLDMVHPSAEPSK